MQQHGHSGSNHACRTDHPSPCSTQLAPAHVPVSAAVWKEPQATWAMARPRMQSTTRGSATVIEPDCSGSAAAAPLPAAASSAADAPVSAPARAGVVLPPAASGLASADPAACARSLWPSWPWLAAPHPYSQLSVSSPSACRQTTTSPHACACVVSDGARGGRRLRRACRRSDGTYTLWRPCVQHHRRCWTPVSRVPPLVWAPCGHRNRRGPAARTRSSPR